MAKYQANQASSMEAAGGQGFRITKDGERVRVVFLYDGPESIDGWGCHRYARPSGYTVTMDCPRTPKDPIDDCPACKAGDQLYTRIFVRMLNLNTNEVVIWDRASSFRRDLTGFMQYFNPLYSKVYEITRRGSGLQTQYQYQSLDDSGITPEKYAELVAQADAKAADYVRPVEQYVSIKSEWENAKKNSEEVNVQAPQSANAGAWGPPAQGAWGQSSQQPPQAQWGQAPQNNPAPQGQWGQSPAPQPAPNPAPAPQPQGQAPQNWGQPANGQAPAWGQAPQSWGQN